MVRDGIYYALGMVLVAALLWWLAAYIFVAVPLLLALFFLSVHIGWQVTYKNGDVPNDMLVYVQSSPDVPFVMRQTTAEESDL